MFSNLAVELLRLEIAVAINHLIQKCGSSHLKINIQRVLPRTARTLGQNRTMCVQNDSVSYSVAKIQNNVIDRPDAEPDQVSVHFFRTPEYGGGRITEFDGEVSLTIGTDGRTEKPHHFLAQRFRQRSGVRVVSGFLRKHVQKRELRVVFLRQRSKISEYGSRIL